MALTVQAQKKVARKKKTPTREGGLFGNCGLTRDQLSLTYLALGLISISLPLRRRECETGSLRFDGDQFEADTGITSVLESYCGTLASNYGLE